MKFAIILCGGSGERLWPLSTNQYPKQFHKLINDISLLDETIKRIPNDIKIILVTNSRYTSYLKYLYDSKYDIISEPVSRNTAASILIASLYIQNKYNLDLAKILVLPSDHYFNDTQFTESINKGFELINGNILTFGIKPTYPETGYGYINYINAETEDKPINKFIEKPSCDIAKEMIEQGNHLWNSGIFMFDLNTIINEFSNIQPKIYNDCIACLSKSQANQIANEITLDSSFQNLENISFDYAIMEHTKKGTVIEYTGCWSDIGDWNRIFSFKKLEKNQNNNNNKNNLNNSQGNITTGHCITNKTSNSYLSTDKGSLLALGLNNIIAIKSNDNVLIADSSNLHEIKTALTKFNKEDSNLVMRPWGFYKCIDGGTLSGYQVKKISVYPGKRLSLQYHNQRSEHWTIITGIGLIQINDDLLTKTKDDSVFIPIGAKHRVTNIGNTILEFIEVQIGNYLGEDDIVRIEDDFNRV